MNLVDYTIINNLKPLFMDVHDFKIHFHEINWHISNISLVNLKVLSVIFNIHAFYYLLKYELDSFFYFKTNLHIVHGEICLIFGSYIVSAIFRHFSRTLWKMHIFVERAYSSPRTLIKSWESWIPQIMLWANAIIQTSNERPFKRLEDYLMMKNNIV